jgi:hypothetical protein
MRRFTLKTSTIFVAAGKKTRVYRSVDEVPERLRKRLVETTTGMNSATILIADRNGREQILRALQGAPNRLEQGPVSPMAQARERLRRLGWREWAYVAVPGVMGLAAWLLYTWR